MYLSAERLAAANKAVQETFEETSVAWQAIPHWDTGDPGQTRVRSDIVKRPEGIDPFGGDALEVLTKTEKFYVTLAQACASTPDALLAAVMPRTVKLAEIVDYDVVGQLDNTTRYTRIDQPVYVQELLDALIDARVEVEDAGYRAPSCLLVSKTALKALSHLVGGVPVTESLLSAANINSLHRARRLDVRRLVIDIQRKESDAGVIADKQAAEEEATEEGAAKELAAGEEAAEELAAGEEAAEERAAATSPAWKRARIMLMLGRRQRIAHGCAATASPGEEPVDLAVSVPPSLEVVGETANGNIELAVRIRYATRIKDERGVVAVVYRYKS